MNTTSGITNVAEPIKISNSGVSTWLVCQRQYYYKYDLAMVPLHNTESLDRGILGHEVLAEYYEAIMQGTPHDEAVNKARTFLMQFMGNGTFDLPIVLDVDRILQGYWPIAARDIGVWQILNVEQTFDVFLTEEFSFTMRLDLLIFDKADGKIKVVDHKFVYNFKTEDEKQLDPQMPKYIAALRASGVKVEGAIYNQLRYRKLKDPNGELYRREPYMPTNNKVVNITREQITASQEIIRWKNLPLETRAASAKRILNQMVCKMCGVRALCMAELDGNPIEYLMATEYKVKDHNSSEPTSAELESLI